jgi:hypothetical protein
MLCRAFLFSFVKHGARELFKNDRHDLHQLLPHKTLPLSEATVMKTMQAIGEFTSVKIQLS